jgi:outer membrane lipoprotein-sorting protein
MTSSGAQAMTTEADFVAPDRFRMQMPMGTQYIIGDTMYMTVQGRSMKVPMGKGTMTQWRDPANLAKHEATMTVKALGSETVGGKPAKKYETTNTQPQPSTSTMWVGSDGYPLQIQVSSSVQGKPVTTTIRYSRFNDPTIKVDPPQ